MLSIFPVVFDRIEAFSKPLYGFSETLAGDHVQAVSPSRLGPAEDLEPFVVQFLQNQEKAGGPPMAVSVVLDATQTKNLHIERGFSLADSTTKDQSSDNVNSIESAKLEWPAVFLRTTTHHGTVPSTSTAGAGILGGIRRSAVSRKEAVRRPATRSLDSDASMKSLSNSSINRPTSSSLLRNWSTSTESNNASSSPVSSATSRKKAAAQQEQLRTLMEYSPDSSWPHTAWPNLVALLTGNGDMSSGNPESPIPEPPAPPLGIRHRSNSSSGSITFPGMIFHGTGERNEGISPQPSSPGAPGLTRRMSQSQTKMETNFFVAQLSDYMWLVVMVKAEEESLWHRRRARAVVEEEVRDFLKVLSKLLSVAEVFAASRIVELHERIAKATKTSRPHDLQQVMKTQRVWNDKELQEFFQIIKETFGLRLPRGPMVKPTRRLSLAGFRTFTSRSSPGAWQTPSLRGRNRIPRKKESTSLETSFQHLFLGGDLVSALGD